MRKYVSLGLSFIYHTNDLYGYFKRDKKNVSELGILLEMIYPRSLILFI